MKPLQTLALAIALLFLGTRADASPLATAAVKAGAMVTKANLAAFGAGLTAGIYVTQKLHKSTGFWGKRIPGTRYRMADIPVGGMAAAGAAVLFRNHPEVSHFLLAASAGMTAGAVGTGIADPLPKK